MNKPRGKAFDWSREFTVILKGLRSDFKLLARDLSTVKNKVDLSYEELLLRGKDISVIKADLPEIKLTLKE